MERTRFAKRLATVASAVAAVIVAFALIYWQQTKEFIQQYDAFFKLIGLAVGPFLAVLGFIWGLADKAEMRDLGEALGSAKKESENAQKDLAHAQYDVQTKVDRIKRLEEDLDTIIGATRLGKLRKNAPFTEYLGWKHDPVGAKIVTVGLFKGGVGKSHLASNFAAYVSEKQRKKVLLVDLDYQGSMSVAVLTAAGLEPTGSKVDDLFSEYAGLPTLTGNVMQLAAQSSECALNGGRGLAQAWLVPSDYTLAEVESRLLVDRIINDRPVLDERYRLAHVLLDPTVRRQFAMIVIDTPPRMTLGTVNALVASHHYIVPTKLDRVSSEAVRPFLVQVERLKEDLNLDVSLAGIVGTLTQSVNFSKNEQTHLQRVNADAKDVLKLDRDVTISTPLPTRAAITNNVDLGYFLKDGTGNRLSEVFYDKIFDELWANIMEPPNHFND